MTALSLAARNLLAQDADLKALLGKSASWDTWIFDESPVGVKVENSQRCWIVINENGTWTAPNEHNTMEFPRLELDIWADPSRNDDLSVKRFDAKTKIKQIQKLVDKHLHTIDMANNSGMPIVWGTAAEIANKTGVVIAASQKIDGPDFRPVTDSQGTWMATYVYGVNQVS